MTSGSLGGGVGAGVLVGVTHMDMDITATAIPTTAAVVIPTMATATGTAMDTEPSTNLSTAAAANPELRSCSGGWHGLVITMDPLTESSAHKRGAQSGRTSKSTGM